MAVLVGRVACIFLRLILCLLLRLLLFSPNLRTVFSPCLLGWNRSPAQVGCMRQALGPGALGRPRGSWWRGKWVGGSGWGTHVNPWLFHFNVWKNSLQKKKNADGLSHWKPSPSLLLLSCKKWDSWFQGTMGHRRVWGPHGPLELIHLSLLGCKLPPQPGSNEPT